MARKELKEKSPVKTIERIIILSGGLDALEEQSKHVYKPPFLPIWIRYLGVGPRGFMHVSVAQMIPCQEMELLESEVSFEIAICDGAWAWLPVSFRQGTPALYHECFRQGPKGSLECNADVEHGLQTIACSWEEILVARGYRDLEIVM